MRKQEAEISVCVERYNPSMPVIEREANSTPSVIGTGLIALDVVINGEETANMRLLAGGTCGNVLAIMAYLGWKSFPVARLNGDPASQRVRSDLSRWGVRLDFANQLPGGSTPIIVQKIKNTSNGGSSHTFSWACPSCGADFPRYKAILASSAKSVSQEIEHPNVFFTDRVSPASLILAKACAEKGALVVFEPSAIVDHGLFMEMLKVTHILKYSAERLGTLSSTDEYSKPPLQIETCGAQGLRFRLKSFSKEWHQIDAYYMRSIKDTCGAGDWMTAGLIHCLGTNGARGLLEASRKETVDAIKLGQAMAVWNCQFISARGGMYEYDNASMRARIQQIVGGVSDLNLTSEPKMQSTTSMIGICPSCDDPSNVEQLS